MLLALSWMQVEVVRALFVQRFAGDVRGEPTSWRHLVLQFLAKSKQAERFEQFRGVRLTDVLAKWYMQGLMILLRRKARHIKNEAWHQLMIFGFEPSHATSHLVVALNVLLTKGAEWANVTNARIGSAYVKAAFDNLTVPVLGDELTYWKFNAHLVRALLEESLNLTASSEFPGAEPTDDLQFGYAIRQGGVESPWEWDTVLRHLLINLVSSWEAGGFGIQMPCTTKVTRIVWADNKCFWRKPRTSSRQ